MAPSNLVRSTASACQRLLQGTIKTSPVAAYWRGQFKKRTGESGAGLFTSPGYAALATVARDDASRCLDVTWSDGSKGTFAYAWLRDNAPSAHTYNFGARNRARHLLMRDLDPELRPSDARVSRDGTAVEVAWDGGLSSTFPSDWLAKRNISSDEFHHSRRLYHRGTDADHHWSAAEASDIIKPGADWNRLLSEPRYLRDQLRKFMTYGLLHITNAPAETGALNELGNAVGYLLNSHHGVDPSNNSLFQVYVELDPCNLMNTPKALGLHTDFPQYQSPPEVQILHVVRQAGKGGDSQFVDGFHVASLLKEERPEIYETLTRYPIEYIDWGEFRYAYEFAAKWRVVELAEDGRPRGVFFNNAVRSWYYEAPPKDIPKIYDALKVFDEYCYQERNLLEYKMEKGEMMMFANNRVLHGRSAFQVDAESEGGTRHLEGAFMSFDVIRSKIRVLNEQLRETKHAAYELH